jgi:RNase P protein component
MSLSIVVNARPSAAQVSFQELSEDFAAAVQRASARLPRP